MNSQRVSRMLVAELGMHRHYKFLLQWKFIVHVLDHVWSTRLMIEIMKGRKKKLNVYGKIRELHENFFMHTYYTQNI